MAKAPSEPASPAPRANTGPPLKGTEGLSDYDLDRLAERLDARIGRIESEWDRLTSEIPAANHAADEANAAASAIDAEIDPLERELSATCTEAHRKRWYGDGRGRSGTQPRDAELIEERIRINRLARQVSTLRHRHWKAKDESWRQRERARIARQDISDFETQLAPVLVCLRARRDAIRGERERRRAARGPVAGASDSVARAASRRVAAAKRVAVRTAIVHESWLDLAEFEGTGPARNRECAHCGERVPARRRRFCSRSCQRLHAEAFNIVVGGEDAGDRSGFHVALLV